MERKSMCILGLNFVNLGWVYVEVMCPGVICQASHKTRVLYMWSSVFWRSPSGTLADFPVMKAFWISFFSNLKEKSLTLQQLKQTTQSTLPAFYQGDSAYLLSVATINIIEALLEKLAFYMWKLKSFEKEAHTALKTQQIIVIDRKANSCVSAHTHTHRHNWILKWKPCASSSLITATLYGTVNLELITCITYHANPTHRTLRIPTNTVTEFICVYVCKWSIKKQASYMPTQYKKEQKETNQH